MSYAFVIRDDEKSREIKDFLESKIKLNKNEINPKIVIAVGGDGTILYDHNEIIELYNLGYTQKQIANKLGCIDETVRNVLKAHNIDSSKNYKESLLVD